MQSLTQKEIQALLELERKGELTPEMVYQRAALRKLQADDNYVFSAVKYLAVGALAVFFGGVGVAPIFAGLLAYNWYKTYNKRTEARRQITSGNFVELLDESDRVAYEEDLRHYQKTTAIPVAAEVVPTTPKPTLNPTRDRAMPAPMPQPRAEEVTQSASFSDTQNPFDTSVLDAPQEEQEAEQALQLRSPVDHLIGRRLRSSLIISVSGGGKDIILSNALRQLIAEHPDFRFFVMDCKDDPKETGYYANLPNTTLYRLNLAIANWRKIEAWVDQCLDEFLAIPEQAILICNEGTEVRRHSRRYVDDVNKLLSTGDSRQKYVLEAGQSAHTDDLRINGATRSRFRMIIVGMEGEEMQIEAVLAAKCIADSAKNMADVRAKYTRSPVNRCWSDGQQWYAMPELQNYSGYNRDTRSQVSEEPVTPAFVLSEDVDLFEGRELQKKTSDKELTIEESLIAWFSKRAGEKYKIRAIVQSKAKGLAGLSTEELTTYLDTLVAEGKLSKQEDFYYQKFSPVK